VSFFEELKRRNVFRVAVAYIVASWVALQVSELVLETINAPEWVLQTLLYFFVLGFVAAVIVAWAYEMTPEGIRRESEVVRSESITHQTAAKLDRITIGLLVAVVAIILVERFVLKATQPEVPAPVRVTQPAVQPAQPVAQQAAADNSLAVLPFVAMSSGEDDEYFADGLTEEILNALAQLPELLITARTSAFSFKGQDIPVTEIAEKLGVAHIVEGSVRRSGERLRVTAQLVRAADGFHLWSQNYDSTSADTIQVQEDIAEQIAVAMDVVMDEGKRQAMRDAGLRDVEAFVAMQKALELYESAHSLDADQSERLLANEMFEQVLSIVPGYPPALEHHADAYTHILGNDAYRVGAGGASEEELTEAYGLMLADLSAALENARNFSEENRLQIDLAFVTGNWRGITSRIEQYMDSEGCTEPTWSPQVAVPFMDARRYAERVHELVECDPLTTSNWTNEARARLWAGEYEQALRLIREGMDVAPGGFLPLYLNHALIAKGEFEEYEHINENAPLSDHALVASRISRLAAMGTAEGIPELFEQLAETGDVNDFRLQMLLARAGEREASNELAARVDRHLFGPQSLIQVVVWCMCGAPWDLEATPNFARKVGEAGFDWPPKSPIDWPLKDW